MKKNVRFMFLFALALAVYTTASCEGSGIKKPGSEDEGKQTAIVPTRADRVVIYEVNPVLFGSKGALKTITGRLDEIASLGVNVLWMMPIYEEGTLKASGSPYCIRDYKSVNSDYGTVDDLKALVRAAHDKGMRVIFDWVGNHTSWDNVWITEHPDWYSRDANGNMISPPGFNWNDVADLNFDNADMRAAMLDAMLFWVGEAGIDGYRCDYADGVPLDFWKKAIDEMEKLKGDDLLMLAESGKAEFFEVGFDMAYAWDYASALQGVYSGRRTMSQLYATAAKEDASVEKGKQQWMRHTTNHDMNSERTILNYFGSLRGAMTAYVIAATMGGCPMIYSSQEVGYDKRPNFFNNDPIDWNQNPEYLAEYQKFMAKRATSNALQASGDLITYNVGDRVACYVRTDGEETILVMANTSPDPQTIALPMDFQLKRVTDFMTGEKVKTDTTFALDGYEYILLKK
jgi:glycosidase